MLQFVQDGLFKAELNEFLTRELAEDGYSGVEVRVTPTRTEIIILATRTQNVLGEKGRRIRELTSVVQKRYNFPEGTVEVSLLAMCLLIAREKKFTTRKGTVQTDWDASDVRLLGIFPRCAYRLFHCW